MRPAPGGTGRSLRGDISGWLNGAPLAFASEGVRMARARPITPLGAGPFLGFHTALDACVTTLTARTPALGNHHQDRGQGIARQRLIASETWARLHSIHRLEFTVTTTNHGPVLCLVRSRGVCTKGRRRDSLRVEGDFGDEYATGKLFSNESPIARRADVSGIC